jgi:intracellular multiplication protein IcmV
MKNKSEFKIVRVLSRIFNFRAWADWDRVKSFTRYLGYGVQRMVVPDSPIATESFKEAMKRLGLSEEDLLVKQKALLRLSRLMVFVAGVILIYAGYHLVYGGLKAAIISLVVMMISLVLAFRYHFWYYQMKTHKLGCTFNQWYRFGLLGEKE